MRQNNNFALASHLICTFLCRLCSTTTWNCCLRTRLHGGRGAQVGEVARGVSPHLSCKRDQTKVRDYMDRRDTPPKAVTTPALGLPPPCKQGLILLFMEDLNMWRRDPRNSTVRGFANIVGDKVNGNNRDKDWKNANFFKTFFKQHFRRRERKAWHKTIQQIVWHIQKSGCGSDWITHNTRWRHRSQVNTSTAIAKENPLKFLSFSSLLFSLSSFSFSPRNAWYSG